jgi:hypothetical protein
MKDEKKRHRESGRKTTQRERIWKQRIKKKKDPNTAK